MKFDFTEEKYFFMILAFNWNFYRCRPLQKPCTIKTCSTLDQTISRPVKKIKQNVINKIKYKNNARTGQTT